MAGQRINIGGHIGYIDYHDGEGSAVVSGRIWRWEFHEYCGPSFINKDGSDRKRIPSEHHPVWDAFHEWLQKYKANRKKTPQSQIIKLDIK